MARKITSGVKMTADFSQIIKSMGAFDAMAWAAKNEEYLSDVIETSFELADNEFNILAAAQGATGSIAHMYEWGTQGINKGRSNVRPNPSEPRARLWQNTFVPKGLGGTLTYTFKPSFGDVPKPTKAQTGMDPAVIKKLSTHVFTWKSRVMELGQSVTIKRKSAQALLIPLRNKQLPTGENYPSRIKRGYVMSKGPIETTPGVKTKGNFTAFWTAFWEEQGQKIMDANIELQIREDFEKSIEQKGNDMPKPPVASIPAAVRAASRKEQVAAKNKARMRRRAGKSKSDK